MGLPASAAHAIESGLPGKPRASANHSTQGLILKLGLTKH